MVSSYIGINFAMTMSLESLANNPGHEIIPIQEINELYTQDEQKGIFV